MNIMLADAGVPMLAVYWPVAWVALIPIIYWEARIGTRMLSESFNRCCWASVISNAVSTFIGLPMTWGLLVALQMHCGGDKGYGLETFPKALYAVTVQAPWLIPYHGDLVWMVPCAILVISVPFYVMSVAFELLVVKCFFRDHPWKRLIRWMLLANGASYGLLIVLGLLRAIIIG